MNKDGKFLIKLDFPFNWNLKLNFAVLPSKPTPSIIKNGRWMRILRVGGETIPVIVESIGRVEKPRLLVLTPSISYGIQKKIKNIILDFHGIKDATPLYHFMEKDDVLKNLKRKLYGFGRAGLMSLTIYEGIVKSIIQQQISLKVAENIIANLVERYGEKFVFHGEYIYDFPSPEKISRLSVEELRNCGLSRRKAEYIKDLSSAVVNGFNPEKLRGMNAREIISTLTSFKGIGKWSAELVTVASMGMDIVPADDLGVRRAVSHFYFEDILQSAEVIKKFAEEKFNGFIRDCLVYLLMAHRMGL